MTAFTVAALGMIGVPPTAGFISKWYLGVGAIESDDLWVVAVLVASSLLNAAYFLPILYEGWFSEPSAVWAAPAGRMEVRPFMLLPPLVTAALVLAVGLFAGAPLSPLHWAKLIAERELTQ